MSQNLNAPTPAPDLASTRTRLSEAEKYRRCYQRPEYAMGRTRQLRCELDVDGMRPASAYLDVGCGRGEMVRYARELGLEAYGLELVPELCDERRIFQGELTALPFPVKRFDYVSCYDVLEHLPESQIRPALEELRRVCRGWVYITTNDKPSEFLGMTLHLTRWPLDRWHEVLSDILGGSVVSEIYAPGEWHLAVDVARDGP